MTATPAVEDVPRLVRVRAGGTVGDVHVPAVAERDPLRITGQLGERRTRPRCEGAGGDAVEYVERQGQPGRTVPPVGVALVAAAVVGQGVEIAAEAVDHEVGDLQLDLRIVLQEQRDSEHMTVDPRVPVVQVTVEPQPVPAAIGAERLDDPLPDLAPHPPPQPRHPLVEHGPEDEVRPREDLRRLRRTEIQIRLVGIAGHLTPSGRERLMRRPAPRGLLAQQHQSVGSLIDVRLISCQRGREHSSRGTTPQFPGLALVRRADSVTPVAGVIGQQGPRPRLSAVRLRLGEDRPNRIGIATTPDVSPGQIRNTHPAASRLDRLLAPLNRRPPLLQPHPTHPMGKRFPTHARSAQRETFGVRREPRGRAAGRSVPYGGTGP